MLFENLQGIFFCGPLMVFITAVEHFRYGTHPRQMCHRKPILWDWLVNTQITEFCSENASIHSLHAQPLKRRMHAGEGDEKNRLLSMRLKSGAIEVLL